jgi:hypothetical protein
MRCLPEGVAGGICGLTLLAIALTLLSAKGGVPQLSAPHFWKGKYHVFYYDLSEKTSHDYIHNKDLIIRGSQLWTQEYDLYEGAGGIVREELTHMNRNRSVEAPMDIRLLDYTAGTGLVFDKGGREAIKGPLVPPAPGRHLGSRLIMGFSCEGKEYEWKTFQGATVDLQRWSAVGSGPKVPLLEVSYFTDATGALLGLTVQVVEKLEPTEELPRSLFEPPPGLHIMPVPLID